MVLTVYSEKDCAGTAKVLKESESNLQKAGIKFQPQSVLIEGNPCVFFNEEKYQGFLCLLEEGRYEDLSQHNITEKTKVCSIKQIKSSLANPQISLYNTAKFKEEKEWQKAVDGKFRCICASENGTWAVKNDFTVMLHGGNGGSWAPVMGKMREVAASAKAIWAVNNAEEVFVRHGVTGKEWTKIDGSMKTVSVGWNGICWAVDKQGVVWRRLGAKDTNPIGSKWQSVSGRLSSVTVGQSGVWGLSPKNEVMYRDQTFGLAGEGEGTGWTKVDGFFSFLHSGSESVWGVAFNGDLYYRHGINQNNPMGDNWFKLKTNMEWKAVAQNGTKLYGIDKEDSFLCRDFGGVNDIIPGSCVNLYEENGNFKSFDLQDKPSSYLVRNAGWVIYSNSNFKGKALYQVEGECYSNDPPNPKGPKLKSFHDPVGSIRPIRGIGYSTLSVSVQIHWDKIGTKHNQEVVHEEEGKNNTFEYESASWARMKPVTAFVEHNFELDEPVEGCMGSTFTVDNVPKTGTPFSTSGTLLETGTDFRQELSSSFTFTSDTKTFRRREKKEVIRFPPVLQPKTVTKVNVVVHSGVISMPFTATFISGSKSWTGTGKYTGTDSTQIKLQFKETSLLEGTRKISRI